MKGVKSLNDAISVIMAHGTGTITSNLGDTHVMESVDLSKIEETLLKDGVLQVLPYDNINHFSQVEVTQFCVKHGFYSVPTLELVDFLKAEFGDTPLEKVIEIGAGNGVLSNMLSIHATDNFMQEKPEYKALYEASKQAPVRYGKNLEEIDANNAVKKYKPEIVLACWVTHKYNQKEHFRGGNVIGVNEKLILEKADKYIHVGNESVHSMKPILRYKKREVKADWLVSRSMKKEQNVIWIWEK